MPLQPETETSPEREEMRGKPLDILLITVDQWRGTMLPGESKARLAPTPHLDALAREGVRFRNHFCQAYPCGPARAGLVTGLYPHKHRSIQNGVPLDARHPTLFTEMRRAGYRPRLFGYTDTTADPRQRVIGDPARGDYEGVAAGLDVDTLLTEAAVPWLAHLKARGYPVPHPEKGRDGIFAQRGFGEPAMFAAEDSEAAFLSDRFISWLGVAGPQPFFAHLSFIAPHPPFAAAEPFSDLVDPTDVDMPLTGATIDVEASQHPLIAEIIRSIDLAGFAPGLSGPAAAADEGTIRKIRAIYAGLAAEVDGQIGRIVAALKAARRFETTLIVFTADHGEQLFDHRLLGKTGYFDQSAHIPLILRDPRAQADAGRGTAVDAFTESIDILPTLLAATGLAPPHNADGRSLLDFCRGVVPSDWRDEAHWSYDFRDIVTRRFETAFGLPSHHCNLQAVRTSRLKYVHFAGMPPVLFDLAEDPGEMINRAADPAYGALLAEGRDRLLTWRMQHEDRALTQFLARDGVLYEEK